MTFLIFRSRRARICAFAVVTASLFPCGAVGATDLTAPPESARSVSAPVSVTLPSAKPSGRAETDQIYFLYYAARRPAETRAPASGGATAAEEEANKPGLQPAIVLLPPIGSSAGDIRLRRFAAFLADRGISVALMTLPFHGRRWPRNENQGTPSPNLYFTSGDPERNARSFEQAASDVSTVATWLLTQPGVDAARLGVGGISLGAIVTHIAMGMDERLGVGVAMLGGGDLADLYKNGLSSRLTRFFHPSTRAHIPWDEAVRTLSGPDPLTNANRNRPRRVFMVEAARDVIIPPRNAQKLWNALGRPPIRWLDSNHLGLAFNQKGAQQAAWEYYESAWGLNNKPVDPAFTPQLSTLTFKLGLVAQLRGPNSLGVTPALTYQPVSFGHRADHLPVAHADIGITGRGPFLAFAATVTPYFDIGLASRIGRTVAAPRPYLSAHITF